MIATVIGLIIAFVPEGLPLAMSLTLTFTALNMRRKQVLVKKLSTVETLGCVNVITSDKTGTLTRNEMHVSELFVGLQSISAKASVSAYESNDESITEMIRCLTLCNQAFYRTETSDNSFDVRRPIVGNSSDVAFLDYCSDFVNVTNVRTRYTKLAEIPFNSRNKYMTTIVQEDADTSLLFMKGAAEIVLKKCTNILLANGTTCPLTDTMNDDIKLHIEQYAKEGKRVFAAAKLQLNTEIMPPTFDSGIDFPIEELIFIGLVALIDPPRTDVLDTLVTLRKAGIKMTIVTGDHPSTAIYIARSLGIISNHLPELTFANANILDPDQNAPIAILGDQIACLTNDQWKAIKDREVVFARTTPEQKLMVVKAYQRMGCIVAATGDGTNDAPALKQANVGIALGSGSEIAKEAADMILLDNSFNSIAIGVRHGRLAFDNLRKIVTYVLPAGNWAEMIPIFLSAFMGTPVPLSPFLMIYICVGTDVGPSLALVTEPAEGDTMTRKPRIETKEKLVDIWLFAKAFLFLGSIECIGALTMFFVYFYWYAQLAPTDLFFTFDAWSDGYKGHTMNELNEFLYTGQSIYFIALVMIQIGQVLTTRLSRNNFYQQGWVWKNPNLLIGILIEIILAVAIIYIPILNIAFKTRQPPVQFWFMPLVFSLLMFVMNEVWKFIQRARRTIMRREADVVL
jgi:sodium/potassium-transporting ATPase subunit alpha